MLIDFGGCEKKKMYLVIRCKLSQYNFLQFAVGFFFCFLFFSVVTNKACC